MDDDEDSNVWVAMIMKLTLFFMIVAALSRIEASQAKKFEQEPPGAILVELYWPDDANADVDLWVEGPTGGPVGYSRRSNPLFNLLRDDLGQYNDLSERNYENVYSRGIVAGEYVVNAMLFSGAGISNLPVRIVVSVRNQSGTATTQIGRWDHTIARVGDEDTVIRFSLTKNGALVPGSENAVPRRIRNP